MGLDLHQHPQSPNEFSISHRCHWWSVDRLLLNHWNRRDFVVFANVAKLLLHESTASPPIRYESRNDSARQYWRGLSLYVMASARVNLRFNIILGCGQLKGLLGANNMPLECLS